MYTILSFVRRIAKSNPYITLTQGRLREADRGCHEGGGNLLFLPFTKRLFFLTAAVKKRGFLRQPHDNKRTLTDQVGRSENGVTIELEKFGWGESAPGIRDFVNVAVTDHVL